MRKMNKLPGAVFITAFGQYEAGFFNEVAQVADQVKQQAGERLRQFRR